MIKKLRRSFVRVAMLAAALVLIVLMGVVNVTNYVQRSGADMELLTILAENGGHFPGDNKGGRMGRPRFMTEETPYETRYFSVLLGADGTVLRTDTAQIAAVTPEDAAALAQSLAAAGRTGGSQGSYRYAAVEDPGGTLYVFLDCSRNRDAVRTFLTDSVIVTAAGLAVLFGLAWLLSNRAVRPIAESYEKQKTFITNAGHELKTPLAVIESSADVIELEAGESRWTRSIHAQVERLSTLTQQLIALTRMDENEGGAALALEELDVSAAVSAAAEPFELLAEAEARDFTAAVEPGLRAMANRDALEKITAILADNALKYAAPGGAIRLSLAPEGRHILLRTENPAEGLSPGKQERLFDRFYRGDASRGETPGYGLGLPLARSLAEGMGGTLTAHSPDGQNLIVTLRLG